jgi:hypothetical protein
VLVDVRSRLSRDDMEPRSASRRSAGHEGTPSTAADSPGTGGAGEQQRCRASLTPPCRDEASGKTYGAMTTKEGQFIPVLLPTIVRIGVGAPDVESWSLPNSTVVGLLKLETQTSPQWSTATP